MNFLIMLILKYVFFTVILFLMGMFMHCLFDGECLECWYTGGKNRVKLLRTWGKSSVV